MTDRSNVKWQPFNAVASGSYMVNEVLKEKSKEVMPTLSDDQRYEIQEKIFNFYNTQEIMKIKFYRDGKIYIKEGKISFIDKINHNIIINKAFKVFFNQIIAIY